MPKSVRPRIKEQIYELLKRAASSRCIPFGQWLAEAIAEKAAREGFEIINGKVESTRDRTTEEHFKIIDGTMFYSEAFVNEMRTNRNEFIKSFSKDLSKDT